MTVAEALFRPFRSDNLSLPNRVVMAPMTRSRSPEGMPSEKMAGYYARRAAANVGLIVTEGVAINREGALDDPNVPHFWGDALPMWKEVADEVHAAGGKIFPQLWHVGATASNRSQWTADDPRIEGPSGLRMPDVEYGRAMTDGDISAVIAAYAQGAADAEKLGFDGVEVHGAHGYLIDQFFWEGTNRREDRYGGKTLADRTRFAVEIIRAMRRAVSPTFPISFRFSQFKQQDFKAQLANTPQELATLLEPLADAGVTVLHASQRRFWEPTFEGSDLNLAGWAKSLTGLTSISVGSVGLSGEFSPTNPSMVAEPASIDQLLQQLDRGDFDLIAVGRALLNDPEWAAKVASGRTNELKAFELSALKVYH